MSEQPKKILTMAELLRAAKVKREREEAEDTNPAPEHEVRYPPISIVDIHNANTSQKIHPKSHAADIQSHLKVDIHPDNVDSNIATKSEEGAISISTPAEVDIPKYEEPDIHQKEKKDRHRSERAGFFARIDPAIAKQIAIFCAKRELEKQDFLEQAAIHFIDHVDIHAEARSDIKISHDDRRKMIWKTLPSIINLYLGYLPDNKWKSRDDREASRYNDMDIRNVELGILTTLLRTEQRKIHSFKYFVEEIDEALAVPLGDETINAMLKRRRQQYQDKKAE